MTLLQRLGLLVQLLGVDVKARPEVVYANTFAGPQGVQAALNARVVKTTPCWIVVAADETTLDNSGNPQRMTYWFDAVNLSYPSLTRADGTVTVAGSEGLGTMPPVADNAALLASPTVYRDTLIKVTSDSNRVDTAAGFYIKEANGKLHQIATNPIN